MSNSKVCQGCNKIFYKGNLNPVAWANKNCCTDYCANKYHREKERQYLEAVRKEELRLRQAIKEEKVVWIDPLDKWLYGYKAA